LDLALAKMTLFTIQGTESKREPTRQQGQYPGSTRVCVCEEKRKQSWEKGVNWEDGALRAKSVHT
jgi:hypothetical protein